MTHKTTIDATAVGINIGNDSLNRTGCDARFGLQADMPLHYLLSGLEHTLSPKAPVAGVRPRGEVRTFARRIDSGLALG
jgi:hypothetical protein